MDVTVVRTEVFEEVETGLIHERFWIDGRGVTFRTPAGPFQFEAFMLRIDRGKDFRITDVALEAEQVEDERLETLADSGLLPVRAEEVDTLDHAHLVLQVQPEVVQASIAPRTKALRDLKAFLELRDAQGQSLIFNLANFKVTHFVGVTRGRML